MDSGRCSLVGRMDTNNAGKCIGRHSPGLFTGEKPIGSSLAAPFLWGSTAIIFLQILWSGGLPCFQLLRILLVASRGRIIHLSASDAAGTGAVRGGTASSEEYKFSWKSEKTSGFYALYHHKFLHICLILTNLKRENVTKHQLALAFS